jgi:hypothetical protein
MKLTEKMKKNLAILGGVLIGIGLIAAIGMQFGSKQVKMFCQEQGKRKQN